MELSNCQSFFRTKHVEAAAIGRREAGGCKEVRRRESARPHAQAHRRPTKTRSLKHTNLTKITLKIAYPSSFSHPRSSFAARTTCQRAQQRLQSAARVNSDNDAKTRVHLVNSEDWQCLSIDDAVKSHNSTVLSDVFMSLWRSCSHFLKSKIRTQLAAMQQ